MKFSLSVAAVLATATHSMAKDLPPVDQTTLNDLALSDSLAAFLEAFEAGDELSEAVFTLEDGVGARVSATRSFTRFPRADLSGAGDWAQHFPAREGGPQAQACNTCHGAPFSNGAGGVALNVAVDPLHTGDPAKFLERNTLHLFGMGAVQRLAEEMTQILWDTKTSAMTTACAEGASVTVDLIAKGTDFGQITVTPSGDSPCQASVDMVGVAGIDADLIVRPFGWKGNHATIRAFTRGAAHNEMGLQAVELVGDEDGDFDGVTHELTIGDMTALTTYLAGLERPVTKIELADLGLIELTETQRASILRGETLFASTGCVDCHRPTSEISKAVYHEPSLTEGFYETILPSGMDARLAGLSAQTAIRFDLTADQPNNRVETDAGEVHLGAFPSNGTGGAVVDWYTDFKRHDMGPGLSDPVDAFGFGASVWLTRSLAGVGSTGPWLHNGNATTLEDAILQHGGDAEDQRDRFAALEDPQKEDLVAFLENLVLHKTDEGEDH